MFQGGTYVCKLVQVAEAFYSIWAECTELYTIALTALGKCWKATYLKIDLQQLCPTVCTYYVIDK